jgi:tetratricopeptide (TPR) repeat protein
MPDDASNDAIFEAAADAIVDGDLATLGRLLSENPGLVHARSSRAHRATLLHYVSANGVEDFRQKTPANIVDVARTLLDARAEVDAGSRSYGDRDTTFMLVATSVHPQRAGVQLDLLRLLLDRGAEIPPNAVEACLANGRGAAAEFLLDRGAPLDLSHLEDADGNGMTLLHHAAAAGSLRVVRMLLDRGAKLEARNGYGGTVLEQAVWSAIHARQPQHLEIIELLVGHGARVDDDCFTELRRVADEARHGRRYEEARSGYLIAVDVCRASGDARLLAHTLRHLGDIEREMGRTDDAEAHCAEALDIARREGVAPLELANTIRVLALLRDDEALWREAHDLYLSVNVEAGVAETARRLAKRDAQS